MLAKFFVVAVALRHQCFAGTELYQLPFSKMSEPTDVNEETKEEIKFIYCPDAANGGIKINIPKEISVVSQRNYAMMMTAVAAMYILFSDYTQSSEDLNGLELFRECLRYCRKVIEPSIADLVFTVLNPDDNDLFELYDELVHIFLLQGLRNMMLMRGFTVNFYQGSKSEEFLFTLEANSPDHDLP